MRRTKTARRPSPGKSPGAADLDALISAGMASADRVAWIKKNAGVVTADLTQKIKQRMDEAAANDPRLAISLSELAVAAAETVGDDSLMGLVWRGKAQAHHQAEGASPEVLDMYQKAREFYLQTGDAVEAARTMIGAIDALGDLGRTAEALSVADQISHVFTERGELMHRAKVDLNVGNLHHRLQRNHEAGEYYSRARQVFARNGDRRLVALADTNLGNVATNLFNYGAAHNYYERAKRILEGVGAAVPATMNEVDIGWLHFIEGDYLRALATMNRARQRFEEHQLPRHVAVCNLDLAEIYLALDNLEYAAASARDAHATFESLGHLVDAGRCLMIIGVVEFRLGNRSRAEAHIKAARAVFSKSQDEALETTARLQLADIALRSGDAQAAVAAATEAAARFASLELTAREGTAEIVLGRAYCSLEAYAEARTHFERALSIGQALKAESIESEANLGIGIVAAATEGPTAAIPWLESSREYVVRVRSLLHPEALKTRFLDGRASVYAHLVEATLATAAPGADARALEIADEAKSQALVDMIAGRVDLGLPAGRVREQAIARRVRDLQRSLATLHSAIESTGDEKGHRAVAVAPQLHIRLAECEQELESRLIELDGASAEYVSLIRPERLSANRMRAMVPSDAALIEYFALENRMVAFIVDRNSIRSVDIPMSQSALTAAIEDLSFDMTRFAWSRESGGSVSGRVRDSLDRQLTRLHDALITPLGPLPARLIVIPHRSLHLLPFQALKSSDGYLVDRHIVSYAPSAGVLRHCLARRPRPTNSALVVGVTAEHLPYIAQEARDVAAQFESARLLEGRDASITELVRNASDADVIHIASRGVFRDEKPIFSGIRMSDGWFAARDAYDLRLNASLVTLSACQTGVTGPGQADETIGLVRGFLYSGASAVLASLWSVDDRSTGEFMPAFYAALRAGQGRADALRTAQLDLKRRWPGPYFWAPFALIGAW